MTVGVRCADSRKRLGLVAVLACVVAVSGCKSGSGQSSPATAVGAAASTDVTATTNQTPTISGSPGSSVTAGQKYTFIPSAADSDGDTLGFSIANRPAWAQFDTATGRLSGTPTSDNIGSYANIQISVSDGKATSALPAFALTVSAASAAATGAATLSWSAPTSNVDGSELNDLGGYVIRYGTSADQLNQTITITDKSLTTYQVTGLTPATYFFAVQSVNTSGAESELSSVASKTIT